MENPRTETARDTDDSDLIDNIEDTPPGAMTSGGNLARDVASQDELAAVDDPEGRTRPRKDDDIHNDQAIRSQRTRDA